MQVPFESNRNCHRLVEAHSAACLVDGDVYFRALYDCFRQARHSIFIVGWDLHSDLYLLREDIDDDYPHQLGELINRLVSEKEGLHVYLLSWDFAMIYALEREFFPRYKLKWRTHHRVHFCLDGLHPVGASQHQKIVVIDDALAFAGGMDLSQWRWDTSSHFPEDPRRVDPSGKSYPPFHDVQIAVDGPAAKALGQLARKRWLRAEGREPVGPRCIVKNTPWPSGVEPDFRHVQVAIARTLPAFKGQSAVREVEQLYLDSIAAAGRCIYIENQYISSHRVEQALSGRLQESEGPEVVIVLPEKSGGWLEQHTMDVLRGRVLHRLRAADRHERLRTFYPRLRKDPHCALMVHAKVMVIDDDIMRIGFSNLSNRSMGLDSQCDLAIAAGSDKTVRSAIARFRNRLLAEHLDADPKAVAEVIEKTGSLVEGIESLSGKERTLAQLSGDVPPEVDEWVPESELLDPEKPIEPDELFDHVVHPDQQPLAYRHLLRVVLLAAGVIALAAFWRWSPVNAWLNVAAVKSAGEWVRQQPLTPVLVMAGYVIGGLVAFPVTVMVIATVLIFGPWWGLLYALSGSELSALVVFGTGRLLGRDIVRRFAGSLFNSVSQTLSDAGLMTVITFRIVPVAPFSVINLIAGVSEIRWRDFALGTFLGMVPGVLTIVLLANRIAKSLRSPYIEQFAALGVTVLAVGAGLMGLRRWIKRHRGKRSREKLG
jgi:phospholipase D1/2